MLNLRVAQLQKLNYTHLFKDNFGLVEQNVQEDGDHSSCRPGQFD